MVVNKWRIFVENSRGQKDPPATWSRPVGNSWRTTIDINPSFFQMSNNIHLNNQWAKYAGPGGWNDPDMVIFNSKIFNLISA
jgi:alpha-galactosidase